MGSVGGAAGAPDGAGAQEYVRSVTFVLDGQERTCWVRHWDWRRTESGQTTVATGTGLVDGSSQVCLDAARHASITLTYRRDSDGSLGYVSSRSPDSEVITTVIEEGTLHDVTVAHTISFECDGERCDAGDHLVTSPK